MNFKVKSTLILVTLAASAATMAQTKAPEPDYTFSFNAGLVSDYRFRGISQTNFSPALQGGVDFSHKSGFYAGAWLSNVKWIVEFNGASTGNLELDLYAGYKGEIAKDLSFDVGLITYQYPGNNSGEPGTLGAGAVTNANTTEFYGALTYSVATLKYSQSTGTFLGFLNSNTSNYLDLTLNFDLGNGLTLTPHIGRQVVKGQAGNLGDYSDYSLSLAKDFGGGITANIAAYGTNADQVFYSNINGNSNFLGKNGVAVGVKFSF